MGWRSTGEGQQVGPRSRKPRVSRCDRLGVVTARHGLARDQAGGDGESDAYQPTRRLHGRVNRPREVPGMDEHIEGIDVRGERRAERPEGQPARALRIYGAPRVAARDAASLEGQPRILEQHVTRWCARRVGASLRELSELRRRCHHVIEDVPCRPARAGGRQAEVRLRQSADDLAGPVKSLLEHSAVASHDPGR